ncbi:MAG: DUF4332 domain-containing protein [Aeoliella sp.]
MRMEQLALDQSPSFNGQGGVVSSASLQFADGLNVVDSRDQPTNELLADLAGHVLYGARLNSWRAGERMIREPAGHVDVTSGQGRFRLQRHATRIDRGGYSEPRLTVAPLDGHAADQQTAKQLLSGLSPEIAARLLVLDATGGPQLDWLLSEELATEMQRLERSAQSGDSTASVAQDWNLDQFTRRDDLTRQIESLLAEKRRTSEALEHALRELRAEQEGLTRKIADARRELERIVAELSERESQLRYHELAEFVERATDKAHHTEQQPALAELDAQIDRWRKSLADLEAREANVRAELAHLHPDDSSPRLSLADQRASIAIAQRLVSDLDSEVARFARPGDSRACLCQQTHARLHPLVDTLAVQVDKVARLIEGYEAALELEQHKSEATHLARAQAELRATLNHLLDRRQAGLRTSRARTSPERVDCPTEEQRSFYSVLEQRRAELVDDIDTTDRRLAGVEARQQKLLGERAGLMDDNALDRLRHELDVVTQQLAIGPSRQMPISASIAPWRASDILAKLTDGRLREVRLTHGGRELTAVDRHGAVQTRSQLSDIDLRLVGISLQLATVAAVARWDVRLPLVLADSFAGLPDSNSAILALVLHDFAGAGHQLVAFTSSQAAIERWRSMGQPILHLEQPVHSRHYDSAAERQEPLRVVSPPQPDAQSDRFALVLEDSIERFSVFGNDTEQRFTAIGIRTVEDLIQAEASEIAELLDRTEISTSVVELWQTHLVLLSFVPDLSLDDAQLLTGAGVTDPEQLADLDADTLTKSIRDYANSPHGSRQRTLGARFSRDRASGWITGARRGLSRWRSSTHSRRWRSRRDHRGARTVRQSDRSLRTRTNGRSRSTRKTQKRPLRFRLSRTSAIVDAPSIGPKTGKRLATAGITTVADLLAADAAATADALDVRHIDAETIVAWQHQAQLMCRIPELLARDTQLLVGCGFSTAEGIAAADATDLLEFAKSYAATPEGTRVLRGSDPPDLERVTKWIRWAGHRRALEAA